MSWDPVCKCGHEAKVHNSSGCTSRVRGAARVCMCSLSYLDVARRAALLEAADLVDEVSSSEGQKLAGGGPFGLPYSERERGIIALAGNKITASLAAQLRRMAEEPPK